MMFRKFNQPQQHHLPRRHVSFGRPDLIALTGFSNSSAVLALPETASAPAITRAVQGLTNRPSHLGDGTNIGAALQLTSELMANAPKGFRKRAWILSDGAVNDGQHLIDPALQALRAGWVNVNTIAFGADADTHLLQRIASATHAGRFFTVNDLRALTLAFTGAKAQPTTIGTKPEFTVYACDLSPSMWELVGGETKIQIVQQAMLNLLNHKRKFYS